MGCSSSKGPGEHLHADEDGPLGTSFVVLAKPIQKSKANKGGKDIPINMFEVIDWSETMEDRFGPSFQDGLARIVKEDDQSKIQNVVNDAFRGNTGLIDLTCILHNGNTVSCRFLVTPGFSDRKGSSISVQSLSLLSEDTSDDQKQDILNSEVSHCFVLIEFREFNLEKRGSFVMPSKSPWDDISLSVFRVAHSAVVIANMRGHVVHFNKRAVDMFGYEEDEVVGRNVSMLMPAVFAKRHERIFRERAREMSVGEVRELPIQDIFDKKEVIGQKKSGELIPVSIRLSRVERDGLFYVVASLFDLTSEKFAEQKKKIEIVLAKMLPKTIQLRLQGKSTHAIVPSQFTKFYESATVFFSDIVGFTKMASKIDPVLLVSMLNRLFSVMDDLADKHGVEKIKTIGDAYMVVGGIPDVVPDHCERTARFALDVIETLEKENRKAVHPVQLRIGLHVGSLVAGIIGQNKYMYDVFGNTVNVASRMESTGVPGRVHVSHDIVEKIGDSFVFEHRGSTVVKGKGEMETYFLVGPKL